MCLKAKQCGFVSQVSKIMTIWLHYMNTLECLKDDYEDKHFREYHCLFVILYISILSF